MLVFSGKKGKKARKITDFSHFFPFFVHFFRFFGRKAKKSKAPPAAALVFSPTAPKGFCLSAFKTAQAAKCHPFFQ